MRVPTIERRRRPFRLRAWMIVAAVLLVILIFSLRGLAGFYTDYLWFDSVGFGATWRGLLLAKIVPAAVFTIAFFVVMLANLVIADRLAPSTRTSGPEDELIERYQHAVAPYQGRIRALVAAFFALIAGGSVAGQWRQWILFRHRVNFGVKDPQFHKDVGFYVFTLPFLRFIFEWAFAALVIVFIVTAVAHYLNGGIRLQSPFQRVTPQVKAHLSVILGVMALVKGVQYYLAQFELNFSKRGVVQGAGYTDVHAELRALQLLIAIAVIAAALFVWNIFRRGWVLPVIAVGLWALLSLIVGTIYPAVVQKFRVDPNEYQKEQPYIARNIAATRASWNLNKVQTKEFNYNPDLDAGAINDNRQTIDNARLWDSTEILRNYQSFQTLGTFYKFSDADVDRYKIGNKTVQVMISARQLNRDDLPSQTWVSRHLVYTHGFGAVISPTNQATDPGGQPEYLLSDIPATGQIRVDKKTEGVYFGEGLGGYSLVDARQAEFDYPRQGRADATTRYSGSGGVEMSSWLRRAAFALRYNDFNLFISGQVTGNSRILFDRDITLRVKKAAPFLKFDADPYPVILDGRMLWVLDGYTATDRYPYAQSYSGDGGLDGTYNYVRNSVKATVDAYDGTITFYVMDTKDPLLRAYRKAFPELFTDANRMPAGLREHLRYPEDLFSLQTNVYSSYHVTNPRTFYNKTELWAVSPDPGSGVVTQATPGPDQSQTTVTTRRPTAASSSGQRIDPIYLLIRLPDQQSEEFLILRPFVPVSRDNALTNLVSFMVAKSDPSDYGQLQTFTMPEGQTVTGPEQVNNAIANNPDISRQFTLLGSQGSDVIQGGMQLIPVNDSILYIRPIYVQAQTGSKLPAFHYVVVWYNNQTSIATNLNDALAAVIQGQTAAPNLPATPGQPGQTTTPSTQPGQTTPSTTAPPASNQTVASLLQQATTAYNQAQDALKAGDLGPYQKLINQVGQYLAQAQAAASGRAPAAPTTATTAAAAPRPSA
ncbi:MAG TPA: UPF0182 family protein [Acidimicrobiia bacterium]|nr:UPF0182 family protein [Acidimicrobiia bacterium]